MGYQTCLHLIDLEIKPESLEVVRRALGADRPAELSELGYILELMVIGTDGFLAFEADEEEGNFRYVPDEEDGTVPALDGKWYRAEEVAWWLRDHVSGGRIVQHSIEGDGAAWGWEFDGQGCIRALGLVPVGGWE